MTVTEHGAAGSRTTASGQAPETPQQSGPMRLTRTSGSGIAQALVLEAGDMIIAVNGNGWTQLRSVENAIAALVASGAGPVLLTVWRGGQVFDVLADSAPDGAWEVVTPEEADVIEGARPERRRVQPAQFLRYAVYADTGDVADVVALRASLMAMVAPPLWFISRRLWEALAAFLCVVLTAFAIAPLLGLGVYLVLCLYVGRRQTALIHFAMARDGKGKVFVLAARSEPEAQQIALRFNDKLQFRFDLRPGAGSGDVDIGLI